MFPRAGHNMVYDPVRGGTVIFGGNRDGSVVGDMYDTWLLTSGTLETALQTSLAP
jgi:hypothetical protein